MKSITHRDQIHGDVRYDPLAVALLNTDALQRLGRVYQLGYAHLIYRGGTHTRLSHVMGAYHVAGKLVDFLRQNYASTEELPLGAVLPEKFLPVGSATSSRKMIDARWDALRHLVRWAALLHDVGHIPLGHTLEDEFDGIYAKHDDFTSTRIPYLWHEAAPGLDSNIRRVFRQDELLPESFRALGINGEQAWQSVMLICLHKEQKEERITFKGLLQAQDENAAPFVRILKEALGSTENKTFFPYMADIVGNTICADFLDYLRRDPSNVGLDVLRDDRVASRFYVGIDGTKSLRMALALVDRRGKPRLDTCTGVVELVRQRFRFAEIIYYHKTKVAASAMLARVFSLIGTPPEVTRGVQLIDIEAIPEIAAKLLSEGPEFASELRKVSFPSSILDPEIGDETLLLWLQEQAWHALDTARAAKDGVKISSILSGISLLQALVRRRLYKVCLTLDRNAYEELNPGSKEEHEIESAIQATLSQLRKDENKRASLESEMAAAAGWPPDSLLLYVPPRKSQAKGIETGALDRGDVLTLGTHSAVRDEVLRLNESYKRLWRMILLVHPKYESDAIGLSKAVDVLVLGIWPAIEKSGIVEGVRKAAWFHYIPEKQRLAAAKYLQMIAPQKPNWAYFDAGSSETTDGTVSTEEHALRALLLSRVVARGGSATLIRQTFGNPDSLNQRISEVESQLTVEGYEGITDKKAAALDRIASQLVPDPKERRATLFKDNAK